MSTATRGAQLRSLRERAGLTQAELAARAGLTTSVLSAYENDRREPRVDVFFRLVELAGFAVQFEAGPELDPNWYDVPDAEDKASILATVTDMAMAMPQRERGALNCPPLGTFRRPR